MKVFAKLTHCFVPFSLFFFSVLDSIIKLHPSAEGRMFSFFLKNLIVFLTNLIATSISLILNHFLIFQICNFRFLFYIFGFFQGPGEFGWHRRPCRPEEKSVKSNVCWMNFDKSPRKPDQQTYIKIWEKLVIIMCHKLFILSNFLRKWFLIFKICNVC